MKQSLLMTAIDQISPVTAKVSKGQEELQQAVNDTRKVVSETNKTLSNITAYEKTEKALGKVERKYNAIEKELQAHKAAMQGVAKPTDAQVVKLAKLEQKLGDAKDAVDDKAGALGRLSGKLKRAQIDVSNLASEKSRLEAVSESYSDTLRKQRSELFDYSQAQKLATKRAAQYKKEIQDAMKANRKMIESQKALAKASRERVIAGAKGAAGTAATGFVAAQTAGTVAGGIAAINHETAATNFKNANLSLDPKMLQSLDKFALDFKATREGQGLTSAEIYHTMQKGIKAGITTETGLKEFVKDTAIIRQTTSIDEYTTEELVKNNAMMANHGYDSSQRRGVQNLVAKHDKFNDQNDLYDGFAESFNIAEAMGLSKDNTISWVLASASNNVKGSEADSAIKTLMASVNVGNKEATKDQQAAARKLGMSNDSIRNLARSDFPKFMATMEKKFAALDPKEHVNVASKLFGGADELMLAMLKNKSFSTISGEMGGIDKQAADIEQKAENKAATTQAGLEGFGGAVNSLAVAVLEPLKEPFNDAVDDITGSIRSVTDWFNKLDDGTAKVVAGVTVASGGLVAAGGALLSAVAAIRLIALGAGLGSRSVAAKAIGKADKVRGKKNNKLKGRINKPKSVASKGAKAAGKIGSKFGLMGAAKVGGKVAARLIPGLGTALLAFDAINFAAEKFTGKGVIDNIAGFFGGGTNSDKKIPTPEQFDKKAEEIKKEETKNLNKTVTVNVTGEVKGLTQEGELILIEKVTEAVKDSTQEREGYS